MVYRVRRCVVAGRQGWCAGVSDGRGGEETDWETGVMSGGAVSAQT